MIREVKVTVKEYRPNSCDVEHQSRDNYGEWSEVTVAPMRGTVEEVFALEVKNMTRWGWTPYDQTEKYSITMWKEL